MKKLATLTKTDKKEDSSGDEIAKRDYLVYLFILQLYIIIAV